MDSKTIDGLLAKIRPVIEEAYRLGGEERAQAIIAAAGVAPPAPPSSGRPRARLGATTGKLKRAPWGTAPKFIKKTLVDYAATGIDPKALHDLFGAAGLGVTLSTVRETLRNLKRDGLASKRRSKWFPTEKLQANTQDQEAA